MGPVIAPLPFVQTFSSASARLNSGGSLLLDGLGSTVQITGPLGLMLRLISVINAPRRLYCSLANWGHLW